jgi:hypothetical protein
VLVCTVVSSSGQLTDVPTPSFHAPNLLSQVWNAPRFLLDNFDVTITITGNAPGGLPIGTAKVGSWSGEAHKLEVSEDFYSILPEDAPKDFFVGKRDIVFPREMAVIDRRTGVYVSSRSDLKAEREINLAGVNAVTAVCAPKKARF